MQAWQVVRHGAPQEALELGEVDAPTPGPFEVVVATAATVLNFNEIDGCRGRYLTVNPPLPYTLGMEVTGEVVAAGPGAEHWLGHRVVATASGAFGAHAELVRCGIDMVFDAPAGLDAIGAAAFFFPFHLAWLGLHERGRLVEGDTVLVHAAAGGVGSAAVQLAKAAGATVIATASTETKRDLARSLGADVAVGYGPDEVLAACDEATGGRGVDVVFDGVGGATTDTSMRALSRGGRLVLVGFASGIEAEDQPAFTPRQLLFGQFDVAGVLLAYTSDPVAVRRLGGVNLTSRATGEHVHASLVALADRGAIRPVVGEVVGHLDLPAALARMEDRATTGRVVVRW